MFFMMDSDNFCLQAEARRTKVKEARKRREERQVLKKEEMLKVRTRGVVSKMMFGNLRPRLQLSLLLPVTLGTAARWRQL